MGVEQDGKVEVHGYVTVDRSRSGMLDGGWNFSWDDCGVSVEDEEVGEVMSLVGFLVRDKWFLECWKGSFFWGASHQ